MTRRKTFPRTEMVKKKKLPTKQVSWAQEQSHGGTHWGYQSIVSYWEAK